MGVIKATVLTHPGAARTGVGSNEAFGSTLATLLSLLSIPLSVYSQEPNPIPLMLGACCFLLVIWSPGSFGWFNRAWRMSGIAIGHSLITLYWVFYILPSGLIMQARGMDPLDLRFRPEARTYWKTPHPTGNMQKST